MGLTPTFQLPYPEATDPADVPVDMRELAERVEAVMPGLGGSELAYAEITAGLGVTTGGVVVVASGARTYEAKPILVSFYAAYVDKQTAGFLRLFLYDGATTLGILAHIAAPGMPVTVSRRLTPSAGSHNYTIQANVDAGAGGVIQAGAGGATYLPAYIRVSRI